MWPEIKKDILKLSEFDKGRQLFGAETHCYSFGPLLSEDEIKSEEKKLKIKIPSELRSFYMELGNGVVGPHYGLVKLENIKGYKQWLPYQGMNFFKKINERNNNLSEDDPFQNVHDELQGLITIIQEGCGHKICLISNGENIGKLVYVSCDGFVFDSDQTLIELYKIWVKDGISAFDEIKFLIDSDKSMKEIDEIFIEKFQRFNSRDLVVSLIGAKKPISIFGSGGRKIYHGASQFPWYEKQLENYRNKKAGYWWRFGS